MSRKAKQPSVSPAKAQDWLNRKEKLGERPPQIGRADGYDVRTVRKKIAEEEHKRDLREARQNVVRSALEKHFADIGAHAGKLRTVLGKAQPSYVPLEYFSEPLHMSLRQHLPRLKMWDNLSELRLVSQRFNGAERALRQKIEKETRARPGLSFSASLKKQGVYEGWGEALINHARAISEGRPGLSAVEYREEETEYGIRLERGAYTLALTSRAKMSMLKRAFQEMMDEITDWGEYAELADAVGRFNELKEAISADLTMVILRRVVPGRCRYCPY